MAKNQGRRDTTNWFFTRREYLLDLSTLQDLPAVRENSRVRLLVPECFDRLVTDPDRLELAADVIRRSSEKGDGRALAQGADDELVGRVLEAYQRLKELGILRVVKDERASPELVEAIPEIVRQAERLQRGQKPTRRAVISQYLVTILEHSRRRSVAIIARGRRLLSKLIGRAGVLELPAKSDEVLKRKQEWFGRLFAFRGGRTTKYFIVVGFAGLALPFPWVGVPGAIFAAIDP